MQSLHNKMCVMQNVQEGLDAGQNRLVRSENRKQPLFFLKKTAVYLKGQTFLGLLRKDRLFLKF